MSSYIFVLCLERFSQMIDSKIISGDWRPLRLSRNVTISHLFYVDDVFLFGTADNTNLTNIMDTLALFGALSGLRINSVKSSIIPPPP